MYFKIAIKNVRKSFKDYTIYFLTLTLADCIFYSFNSIESQKALIEMSSSGKEYVSVLTEIISYVSVFVAVILGSLILYANNFLIKKRNKELGIYMTLGMGKSKISKILIFETVIVGALSLISGLILGLIASQGLSILVSKLFDLKVDEYNFVVSISAIGKTIIYFGIMFLLVMIFNTYVISKYKIIDLLTIGRKTEEIKFKNPFIYLFTFILCVISLGMAYKTVLGIELLLDNNRFLISIILGIIGTVLFFFSLAGFILYIVKKSKGIYFKGLNIFTIKQINSKINTNFISMSVICLMLFITIEILSTGFSFKNSLESGLKDSTPFDASAYMYLDLGIDSGVKSVEEALNIMGIKFENDDKVAYYNEYTSGTKMTDIMTIGSEYKDINYDVSYIKISDYNNMRKLNNEEPINLAQDEVLVTSNFPRVLPVIENYMKDNNTLKIKDNVYKIKNKEIISDNLKTDFMKNNIFTIVINDDFCNNAEITSSNVNINFGGNKEEAENNFVKGIDEFKNNNDNFYDEIGYVIAASRDSIYEGNKGLTISILFVGIYLGIVFLISSMAVLALQQLSEASDSIDRYIALRKLGASRNSINKTIFTQTLVYFSIPIILALIHSIVGIKVANNFISIYNQPDIVGSSIVTACIFIIVYSIYFYTTYTGYKNIVKSKIK